MAETSVKFFHSELPGAPVLSGTAGSLIAVLDACLVNGWGLLTATSVVVSAGVATATFATGHSFEPDSVALVAGATPSTLNGEQRVVSTSANSISWATAEADGTATGTIQIKLAPAGWEKRYSGTNKGAYRSLSPSATGAHLRIDHSTARYARMRGYSAMTDIDTGVDPTPTDAQISGGLYIPVSNAADTTARKWIIVVSDRFVHIGIAHYAVYPNDYALVAAGDFPSLKAGDAYRWVVVGDTSDTSGTTNPGIGNALNQVSATAGSYLMRPYTQTGGAIQAWLYKPGIISGVYSGSTSAPPGPNPINNGIDVVPTLFVEGASASGNRRGEIPGYYGIPHYLGASFDSKDRITPSSGLPGHKLIAVRFSGGGTVSNSYRFALDITGPWE